MDAPGSVTLSAQAQDSDGAVALVEFYSGSTRVGQLFSPPYTMALPNLAASNYTFYAVATDNSGLSATSGVVSVSVHLPEPAGRGTGLNAEYFQDRILNQLFQSRIDTNINFNWGNTAPIAGMAANDFSVRWSGKIQARHAGLHLFHTVSDEPGEADPVFEMNDLTMEFFEGSVNAAAQLLWTQPGGLKEAVPTAQLYPADRGLRGAYFSGTAFNSPAFTRVDDGVNFFWNTNSPDPSVLPVNYSVRWTGKVKANGAGVYQFYTLSDDGVRLWVNGQLIISNWAAHASSEDVGAISLGAGQFYAVTLEYFNAGGAGQAVLSWLPPGEGKQVIPVGNLTPHQNNNPPVLGLVTNRTAVRTLPNSRMLARDRRKEPSWSVGSRRSAVTFGGSQTSTDSRPSDGLGNRRTSRSMNPRPRSR